MPVILDPTIKVDPPTFNPDNVTLELSAEGLARVKDLGITPAKLSFGTWEKVIDYTFTAPATSIVFTGLNGNADKAYLILVRWVSNVATTADLGLRPNSDAGANYNFQWIYASGTTLNANSYLNSSNYWLARQSVVGAINQFTGILFAETGQIRTMNSMFLDNMTGTSAGDTYIIQQAWNNTTSNITSLEFFAAATDGIGIGTRIIVFKLSS